MAAINLLPQDLKPDKSILKLTKKLRKAVVIGYSVFLVAGLVVLGVFFVLNRRVEATLTEQEQLKEVIRSLQETEQRLVLVRDRLGVVNQVLGIENGRDEVRILEEMVSLQADDIEFVSGEISTAEAIVGFNAPNSRALSSLLAQIVANPEYSRVKLNSFNYTEQERYVLDLQIVR